MKIRVILLLVLVCLLAACSSQSTVTKPYELAIVDKQTIVTFVEEKEELKPVERLKRETNERFDRESLKDAGDYYVTKTLEDEQFRVHLESIHKQTLKETLVPAGGNDAYASVTDGEFFYTTAVFTDRIDFYKYTLQMELVLSKTIPNEEFINASNQFIVHDDSLYLLVSNVATDSGLPGTHLWKMDKEFTIEKVIDLEESAALLRMVAVGQTLYIVESLNGTQANGEPASGQYLFSYQLDTGEKQSYPLTISYPKSIYYDAHNQLLVIESDHFRHTDFPYAMIDVSSKDEQLLNFEEYQDKNYLPPYMAIKDGLYYILFADKLVIYDPVKQDKKEIDLTAFSIHHAQALLFSN